MQEKEWHPVKFLIGSSTISYDGLYEVNKKGQVRIVENIRKVNGSYKRFKSKIMLIRVDCRGIAFIVLRKDYEYRAVALTNIMHAVFGKGIKERIKIEVTDNEAKDLYIKEVGDIQQDKSKNFRSRAIVQRDLNGRFIYKFDSITDAVRAGFIRMSIHQCCNYQSSQHRGFKWEYADVNSNSDLPDFE